jgi:hypothetical protein
LGARAAAGEEGKMGREKLPPPAEGHSWDVISN